MKGPKERLTVTVDPHLIAAGNRSVAAGSAKSLSAWVNLALRERVALEERLRAMAEAVAAYEAEHGVISEEELAAASQELGLDTPPVPAKARQKPPSKIVRAGRVGFGTRTTARSTARRS